MKQRVAHITTKQAWDEARRAGTYTADTLAEQGFIHCSLPNDEQLIAVANFLFAWQSDLVVLLIAPERLHAELKWEEYEPGSQLFPHLYGPLNLDAVVDVIPLPPQEDGKFALPVGLR